MTFVTDVVVRSRTRIRRNSAQAGLLLSPPFLIPATHSLSSFTHTNAEVITSVHTVAVKYSAPKFQSAKDGRRISGFG